jgi:hypothetical protein
MPIIEMTAFESLKDTPNKLCWEAKMKDAQFRLYIPQWRVPRPWPSKIYVRVDPRRDEVGDAPNLTPEDVKKDAVLTHEPIVATVNAYSEHTKTIRYRPIGDPKKWEIGEPYVPFSLTTNGAKRLRLIVHWDIASRGSFKGL